MDDKLIKLLQLTQSPNDHEALAAARKANALLAQHGKNWHEFLTEMRRPALPSQPFQQWGETGTGGGFTVHFTF